MLFSQSKLFFYKGILVILLSSEVKFLPVFLWITLAVALPPPPQIFHLKHSSEIWPCQSLLKLLVLLWRRFHNMIKYQELLY